ncbi:MAG: hypothetical protein A3J29_08770 [Acidobacteria bacterium RIFCSPLOWO2_12_FULL_67_14b]|nr:MAG: hypothetical protein A3J29_08770 [Acidobacteria bacterium RIFCSPLOWO2_12_FULL_67_14b]
MKTDPRGHLARQLRRGHRVAFARQVAQERVPQRRRVVPGAQRDCRAAAVGKPIDRQREQLVNGQVAV